jgi:hypothetical protein
MSLIRHTACRRNRFAGLGSADASTRDEGDKPKSRLLFRDPKVHPTTPAGGHDQSGLAQDPQVPGRPGLRYGQPGEQLRGRHGAGSQQSQEFQARRVCERSESEQEIQQASLCRSVEMRSGGANVA